MVLEETQDTEEITERVAALDIGKAEVVCCTRVPRDGSPGRRMQEVVTFPTMTRSLLGMSDHLRCLGVTRVVMETTFRLLAARVLHLPTRLPMLARGPLWSDWSASRIQSKSASWSR
ncbi:hypothetical protein [Streptomyces mirabilis]|uniref:hypothetical protein n=1 Tax=Streptomyces mirabilis TaxID=68239 RepID=UPI0033BB2FE5